jgi:metallo-beta-lactamase class B
MRLVRLIVFASMVVSSGLSALAAIPAEWTRPMEPFRIVGNLYYVGSEDLAAYLVVTPKGLILINGNLTNSPVQIKASVEKLGFHFGEVKILLISHAHYDHCAGSAEIKRLTGAKYEVMNGDVATVESGGKKDFQYGSDPTMQFPVTKVDRVLHDGQVVELGGVRLIAHKTAGHTRGTTTWTIEEDENGKTLHVVIIGSPNVNPGYKLVGNTTYPEIAGDYRHGFEVLKGLPCDVFLGAHGGYFDLAEKYERFKKGDRAAFVDREGYKAYVADREAAFETELKKQRRAVRPVAGK